MTILHEYSRNLAKPLSPEANFKFMMQFVAPLSKLVESQSHKSSVLCEVNHNPFHYQLRTQIYVTLENFEQSINFYFRFQLVRKYKSYCTFDPRDNFIS